MIENSQAISELMRGAINNKAVYGVSYSLIAANQSEYHYLGFQGKNQDAIALEANMQYDLASLTKVVGTTTRILQLLSERKLDLEDPVGKFINDVDKPKITIKQLLLHRSGLRADIKNVWDFSQEALIKAVKEMPQLCPADTKTIYSDLNFILLGWVIQKIDGDLSKSLEEHIFQPIGMTNTSYNPRADRKIFVPTEKQVKRGGIIRGEVHDEKSHLLDGVSGHAGLFSTLTDLTRFAQMYLHKGYYNDQRILPEAVFPILENSVTSGRTLGWRCWMTPAGQTLWHTGFTGTSIALNLVNQSAFVCLTNRVYPTRKNRRWLSYRLMAIALFYGHPESI
ncbi:serine hydrolase [Oenococcus oeni]|uniref:serine hydrolase domain-containing protein n=1 Tax=Oenococcus oeni TaxID=1247 RepID=UPI000BDF64C0|nr:serine hydrolase [Oenococcus oeni]PDH76980.1 serine hydrolase [Oenococcus oeni]PDH85120.1 serine hydrolase [Oenococcus oeni]PDH86793.1 serine hydrolase [Oenococcus oeni]PDH92595.1 serine hydrolase [Oenococcus oeni]RJF38333.1 class C beta-lactamase-related serine hydrolase [Oenococcus oeni]